MARFHERSSQVWILLDLVHVHRENDVIPMSLPLFLVEAGNGSAKSLLYGGVGDGADA